MLRNTQVNLSWFGWFWFEPLLLVYRGLAGNHPRTPPNQQSKPDVFTLLPSIVSWVWVKTKPTGNRKF